jgi:hypothetical protein
VKSNVFVALHGHSDAALRIVDFRFGQRFLGVDRDPQSGDLKGGRIICESGLMN